jgi:hypothetical protein
VILTICAKIPSLRPIAIMLSSDGDLDLDEPPPRPVPGPAVTRVRAK